MSAYVLYGVCAVALAGMFYYANKCAYRLGRIHAANAERQRLTDLVDRIKLKGSKSKEQWCYYRANLTYYRCDARGNALVPYMASRIVSFQVSAFDRLEFNDREIKQLIAPDFIKSFPKRFLCNGCVKVEDVQYLGQFDKKPDGGAA